MDTKKMRGELLAAFEAYKSRVAKAMIGGGEGARVRQILERLSFAHFEAGWIASREAVVVELPTSVDYTGCGEAIKECRAAIMAQGLKVAP